MVYVLGVLGSRVEGFSFAVEWRKGGNILRQWKLDCIVVWRLAVEPDSGGLFFFFPTPRRLRRPNRPNLLLLGFSSKLISWFPFFS